MAKTRRKAAAQTPAVVEKARTGISGLDQITGGGLPRGRTTLVCGGAGCGKTLFGMEFLVKGARDFDEPGVFMSFEERADELSRNVASLGFDLEDLIGREKLVIDHVHIERAELEETGEYDLEGLFIRLGYAIDTIGAKRVVLDTIEVLFATLNDTAILRAELRRLFRWLKDRGVTAIVTAERGEGSLTRHGLEEYVSDCVILLDQRVSEQISSRRLRIVKYRGSAHGTNEYPFLLDDRGFTVVPLTAVKLEYEVPRNFISTGIDKLDEMLGGRGPYRGGTMLVSGSSGTGKSSVAAHFANATCSRGERCLYFALEESPDQIIRNMRSIGIDLKPWVEQKVLRFHAVRPSSHGLEMHLASIQRGIEDFQPQVVVFDPVSSFEAAGSLLDARTMLMRLVDYLKSHQISTLFTSLTTSGDPVENTEVGISSLIDTWILLRNVEQGGERTRTLCVLKARGMAHSNQVREFLLTSQGADMVDVYMGPQGLLTGSARAFQELQDQETTLNLNREAERKRLLIERKRKTIQAKIAQLESEFELERNEMENAISEIEMNARGRTAARTAVSRTRGSATPAKKPGKGRK